MTFKQILGFAKERKFEIIFSLILLLGIFVRVYHFGDWLHFETDQADDYFITSPAIANGIGDLKLLGPRAGAEELRIGPAYYYLEYIGGKVFGNSPFGHAMPNLLLSIVAMPLFYFFVKRYFTQKMSLLLLALYATSFYLIQYARFSWNPNVLPFFVLATFYFLLISISEKEKNRKIFFVASLFFLAITSQLHFNGLFIIVPTYIIFLIIKRPTFSWKTWIAAIIFCFIAYSPVILHEIKYDFSNSKLFFTKISTESKFKTTIILEKIIQNDYYNAGEFFLILTSKDIINSSRPEGYSPKLFCKTCSDDRPWRIMALTFYFISIVLLISNILKEKNRSRKDFLILSTLWLLIGSAYLTSLTIKKLYIYPRFYLVMAPLTFIFIGFVFEKIKFKKAHLTKFSIIFMFALIISFNSAKIFDSFKQLKNSETRFVHVETEDVFPNYYRVPMYVHMDILNYIEEKVPDKNAKIFVKTESEYFPTYWILLNQKGYKFFGLFDLENPYADGSYFSIQFTDNDEKNNPARFSKLFNTIETKDFGSLKMIYLKPKTGIKYDASQELHQLNQEKSAERMHSWNQLF